jgi:hypothetical protein
MVSLFQKIYCLSFYKHTNGSIKYSINYNGVVNPAYYATYSHFFIENCWVLDPIKPTYYAYGGTWAAIAIVFIVSLYCVPESERFSL